MGVEGRWTIFVCTGCGGATGRHEKCDAVREAVPVVPCDDAAVGYAARCLYERLGSGDPPDSPEAWADWVVDTAEAVLRAAGGQDVS
jgi:hypothetical protein